MREQVIGMGAGGHAKMLIEILRAETKFELIGLLSIEAEEIGRSVMGLKILGDDSLLPQLISQGVRRFFVGVGSVRDATTRRRLYVQGLDLGMEPVTTIHPNAIISPSAVLGRGNLILAGAVINADSRLGDNVIINTRAVVEHDCYVGDHAHVATGACLSGHVRVGEAAHVGAGAVVRQNISIGARAIVGAGAAVMNDVAVSEVVGGVPARPLRRSK